MDPLAAQIAAAVRNAPGGGLRRAELEERLQAAHRPGHFRRALFDAYRGHLVDFIRDYVVTPPDKN